MIGFAPYVFGHGDPKDFNVGVEIPQPDGSFTVELLYDIMFQPPGVPEPIPCRTLAIDEAGNVGWRSAGTNGPYEKCSKSAGFYVYAPALRFHHNVTAPMFAVPRLEEFEA